MISSPIVRDWALTLIASEIRNDSPSVQREGAIIRVYERLRRHFCSPVGSDGFQALVSRALSLAKSQFPGLSAVSVTAEGGLLGFDEAAASIGPHDDGEAGLVLVSQMLRLFTNLLGEAATLRLLEHTSLQVNVERGSGEIAPTPCGISTNYLGPFEDISLEAEQLRHVSERLESLADAHDAVDELLGVAGNIRSIATALDIFTFIRNKARPSADSVLLPPTNGYLN